MTDLALFTNEDLAEELFSRADHGLIVLDDYHERELDDELDKN